MKVEGKFKNYVENTNKITVNWGSGCGTNDTAVASDSRGPRFESSNRQLLLNN